MTLFILSLLVVASAVTLVLVLVAVVAKWRRTSADTRRGLAEDALRPQLIEILSADEPDLDLLVSSGERKAGHRDAVDTLALGLLSKLRGHDRALLTELLQRRGVFDRARAQTKSRRTADRLLAAELLGNEGDGLVLGELSLLLDDARADVRKTAARSLGKTGSVDAVPMLLDALAAHRVPYSVVGMALLHIGSASAHQLVDAIAAPQVVVRMVAVDCLGVLGVLAAAPVLVAEDGSSMSPAEQRVVCRALGRIGSPAAVAWLTSMLETASTVAAREEAALALGRIGGSAAHDALVETMRMPGDPAARAAADGLRLCGNDGIETLRARANTDEPDGALARESLWVLSRTHELAAR